MNEHFSFFVNLNLVSLKPNFPFSQDKNNNLMGVTFTEEEMDTFLEKGDTELFLEEIYRCQKTSHRGKGRRVSVKTGEKHPSVKIIPATK